MSFLIFVFFVKQKTAYELRIIDWSSDVCSSDLFGPYADVPKRSGSVYATGYLPVPSEMGLMDVRADVYGQSSMYFSNSAKSITPDTQIPRSDERRVGQECVSTCRSRWWAYH